MSLMLWKGLIIFIWMVEHTIRKGYQVFGNQVSGKDAGHAWHAAGVTDEGH